MAFADRVRPPREGTRPTVLRNVHHNSRPGDLTGRAMTFSKRLLGQALDKIDTPEARPEESTIIRLFCPQCSQAHEMSTGSITIQSNATGKKRVLSMRLTWRDFGY